MTQKCITLSTRPDVAELTTFRQLARHYFAFHFSLHSPPPRVPFIFGSDRFYSKFGLEGTTFRSPFCFQPNGRLRPKTQVDGCAFTFTPPPPRDGPPLYVKENFIPPPLACSRRFSTAIS